MEERRIGMLYAENARRRLSALFGTQFRRSPAFPLIILFVALVIPGGIWFAHTRALFHKTKEKIGDGPQPIVSTGPGGRDILTVDRTVKPDSTVPEFRSATVLPGLGLGLVQISANLPGRGPVSLLVAPTVQELTDGSASRVGPNDVHGAIEVPWGGLLTGLRNILGTSLMMDFQGNAFSVPLDGKGLPVSAEGGLLQTRNADTATVTHGPDGATVNATFADSDFDGHWRSRSQVEVRIELHASSLDLVTTVKNTGEEATPMGIGWHPRFQLAGDRGSVQLRLPPGEILAISDRTRDLPSGKISAAGEVTSRYMASSQPLRTAALDDALVHLKPQASGVPSAELRDPAAGYGLRLTALSSSIGELRVYAPTSANFLSLGFQTNYDNPLGHNWEPGEPAVVILEPGQTLQYKVRLEIFPLQHGPDR